MTMRRHKSLPILVTPPQCNVRFFRACPHRGEFTISSIAAEANDFPQAVMTGETIPSSSAWMIPARTFVNTSLVSSSATTPLPSIDDYEINCSDTDIDIGTHSHKIIYESYPKMNTSSSQPSPLPQQRATETLLNSDSTPIGAFTTSTMERAEDLLHFWIQQPPISLSPAPSLNGHQHQHHHHHQHMLSNQGVLKATQILYRVIDEMIAGNSHANINIEMIDALLHHWNLCISTTTADTTNNLQWQARHEQRQLLVKVMDQLLHKIQTVLDHDSVPFKTFIRALSKITHPSAALAAEEILHIMVQSMSDNRHVLSSSINPDLGSFNMVLASWSNVSVEYGDTFGDGDGDGNGAAEEGKLGIRPGERAVEVLNKMMHMYHMGNYNMQPNLISFSLTIRALLKASTVNGNNPGLAGVSRGGGQEIAVYQACEVLQDMIKMYLSCKDGDSHGIGDVSMKPDKAIFDTVINALGKLDNIDGDQVPAEKALALLRQMKKLSMLPDTFTYNMVIGAFLRHSGRISNRSSHNKTHHLDYKTQQLSNNAIIDIIKELITSMDEEKEGMERDVIDGYVLSSKPDYVTYNSLIKAYANAGNASNAESTLRWMLQKCGEDSCEEKGNKESQNERLRPTTTTWNSVIEAHSKTSSPDSVERSMRVLHKMQSYSEERREIKQNRKGNAGGTVDDMINYDKFDCQPDKISMSLIISALTRSAKRGNKKACKQALQILDRIDSISTRDDNNLMKPDAIMYTSIMDCIAKSNDPMKGKKAMDLLRKMKALHGSGQQDDLKPDTVAYNTVLSALASSGDQGKKCSAKEAEQLLNSMEASGDESIAPNTVSYSTVISAWAKSRERGAADAAVRLLRRMENLSNESKSGDHPLALQCIKPNTISYASTLDALSRSGQKGASKLAMEILQQMEDRFADGADDVRPNAYSYSSVIMAIANNPEKDTISTDAQKLLRHMIKISNESNSDASPNTVVFNSVIKAIEKSSVQNKALESQGILDVMKEMCFNNDGCNMDLYPNTRTYNGVIRCCAFTSGTEEEKRAAFDIATNTLNDLRNSKRCSVDMYTYPAMFKSFERLLVRTGRKYQDKNTNLQEEDFQQIQRVFDMCCEDGVVDSLVLNNLTNILSRNSMRRLLSRVVEEEEEVLTAGLSLPIQLNSLPKSWRRMIYSAPHGGRKQKQKRK